MSDDQQHQIELRLVRLETIIGDKDSGIVSDIHSIKQAMDSMKIVLYKLFGAFGLLLVVLELVFKYAIK